ncbi:MAG: Uma2 family endonuclease [Deltaproteobacteria bacterium]|nr:Uma2 family endonuclease [Deltaproteobacteria bacterium]
MSSPAKKLATYDDVLAAPDHVVAELVAGELHTQPRPAYRHALAGSALGAALFSGYHGPGGQGAGGGWVILTEPELHLSGDVLVPDLAGWRRERMPSVPDAPYSELPPDFCCEVLSPSTARLDRQKKMPLYASHGVGHVWLVDPSAKLLDVFELDGVTYRLLSTHAQDEVVAPPPFEALPLELRRLWSP